MLVAWICGSRIEAEQAEKSKDYACPTCRAVVHVRRRKNYVTHFYHLVKADCISDGEGLMHLAAKRMIGEEYRGRGFDVSFEWTMKDELARSGSRAQFGDLPQRRADLVVQTPGARHVVIEIQDSHLPDAEFLGRNRDWENFGWPVLWLSVPRRALMEFLVLRGFSNESCVFERYNIRPFERQMQRRSGLIWFIVPELRCFFSARPRPSKIETERFVSFKQNIGDFVSHGGYAYASKRYVDLEIGPAVPLGAIRINARGQTVSWQ